MVDVGAHGRAPLQGGASLHRRPRSLGSLIAGFKSIAKIRINELRRTPRVPVWQRNYHDRIPAYAGTETTRERACPESFDFAQDRPVEGGAGGEVHLRAFRGPAALSCPDIGAAVPPDCRDGSVSIARSAQYLQGVMDFLRRLRLKNPLDFASA